MTTAASASPDRPERRRLILERDGARCVWCRREVGTGLVAATTEHVLPRLKGGPSWIENEVLACARCNGARGHATPAEWLEECRRRGWEPDGAGVLRALERLEAAIAARGGQRRARPYLRTQLRRMRRLVPDV
ncbi:MAG TPA: HNH endonuclease [Iamia sp.]|nr:HNH endonuclease [Iamia sp.]